MILRGFFLVFYGLIISSSPTHACESLEQLDWLLGAWHSAGDTQDTLETWSKVSSTTFEGSAISRSKGAVNIINHESMRIVKMEGEIFYIAKVKHNDLPIAFKLSRCFEQQVVFENHYHDFPKRIRYTLQDNELIANIEGEKNKGFLIHFKKNKP